MALNVPHTGEGIALEALVNRTAGQNLVLCLFQNNITPADTDTTATYTEATFTGYVNITLPGASWNAQNGAGNITYSAQQAFTASGAGSQSIYGYYMKQTTSTVLVWSERDVSAPMTIANIGDAIKITPTISAN
jgi:hypothetical protein